MGERLAAGNVGIALLANTAATGAMLFVLITGCGCELHHGRLLVYRVDFVWQSCSDSGPPVSDTFAGIRPLDAPAFILAQFCGAVAAMFVTSWLVRARPH